MAELDLTEAIEAAAVPIWQANNPDYPIDRESEAWDACQEEARHLIEAALPHIERAVREQAAQELTAWAGTYGGGNATQRRMLRHIHMCAQRIAPKPTPEQIAEALARGDFVACHLDDAGRAIPPVDQPEPESSSSVEATNA